MTHGSLFSGIGGFDLAAEWMGWTNVFHCEWAEFPRKILSHYWPQAESYHDITSTDFSRHAGEIDILTGGFPCQPYSAAGKRKGKDDDRHLWPHMLRAVREVRPRWVVGENVFGLTTWNGGLVFEEVCADLEAEGYAVQPFIFPAAAVNAPHRRDRVWFAAYAENSDNQEQTGADNTDGPHERGRNSKVWTELARHGGDGLAAYPSGTELQGSQQYGSACGSRQTERESRQPVRSVCTAWQDFPTQSPICGGDDGLPRELDGITFSKWRNESIKAYGNAIVPQVAVQIFQAIQKMEDTTP